MILSCFIIFLSTSKLFFDFKGQLFALVLLTISTAETALGLSLFIKVFKKQNTLNVNKFNRFKY